MKKRFHPDGSVSTYELGSQSTYGWVRRYPEKVKTKPVACRTCHDSGQVITGVADPDDPWSASTYKNCPRGCRRNQ